MRFFRQKSSDEKRLSVCGIKSVGSIDEIVKKLRQALNKSTINSRDYENEEKIDKNQSNTNAKSTNAETTDENRVKQYLENLRQNIILNKISSDSKTTANGSENVVNINNIKLFSSFTEELLSSDILLELILKLPLIGFESKKLIAAIICNALLLQIEDRLVTVEYIAKEPEILFSLIDTYKFGRSDLTLNSGRILRQCIHHKSLARIALNSQIFNEFFSFVNQKTFDVAMDAFITFRSLLTTHKDLTEEYLTENSVQFFENYMQLINSDNYVTKRVSLDILGLMCESVVICKLFSNDSTHMKVVLNLFWHKYRHIRFRALNIFNVLINSDSQQSTGVMEFLVLQTDRQKLLQVLNNFKDCKTKCKYFLDLKPFAAKLILFFNETIN